MPGHEVQKSSPTLKGILCSFGDFSGSEILCLAKVLGKLVVTVRQDDGTVLQEKIHGIR